MNTPSHAIINMAILGTRGSNIGLETVFIGGILPDIPIYIFYVWAKFIARKSEKQIWREAYYHPFWQNTVAIFHSLPLAALAAIVSHYCGWQEIKLMFLSMIVHCLCDFPLHNHDAHRHFFPFSNYRFISPISYWDPRKNGALGAFIELTLVLIATVPVFGLVESWFAKGLLIVINVAYALGYLYLYRRGITLRAL